MTSRAFDVMNGSTVVSSAGFSGSGSGVGVGVGGNLVNKDWITQGQWDKITLLAKELCASVNV